MLITATAYDSDADMATGDFGRSIFVLHVFSQISTFVLLYYICTNILIICKLCGHVQA